MEVSIKINWSTFWLVAIPAGLFCAVVHFAKRLCEVGLMDILIFAVSLYILVVALLLYIFQCGTEVAKKALDLQIELERRKSEEERRAEENKKCEAAENEQRKHELELAQIASTITLEVSYV